MKILVTMKNPDSLDEAIQAAVKSDLDLIEGIDDDEREVLTASREKAAHMICGKWFRYGEYLTVEVDTDNDTITVVGNK